MNNGNGGSSAIRQNRGLILGGLASLLLCAASCGLIQAFKRPQGISELPPTQPAVQEVCYVNGQDYYGTDSRYSYNQVQFELLELIRTNQGPCAGEIFGRYLLTAENCGLKVGDKIFDNQGNKSGEIIDIIYQGKGDDTGITVALTNVFMGAADCAVLADREPEVGDLATVYAPRNISLLNTFSFEMESGRVYQVDKDIFYVSLSDTVDEIEQNIRPIGAPVLINRDLAGIVIGYTLPGEEYPSPVLTVARLDSLPGETYSELSDHFVLELPRMLELIYTDLDGDGERFDTVRLTQLTDGPDRKDYLLLLMEYTREEGGIPYPLSVHPDENLELVEVADFNGDGIGDIRFKLIKEGEPPADITYMSCCVQGKDFGYQVEGGEHLLE
ncbi:hypothetical protein JXB41_01960 [Candidatus Woesearchaeota archaeon]|nr:hypothetical protein [Candidatus Woesearchaeota archaeon]